MVIFVITTVYCCYLLGSPVLDIVPRVKGTGKSSPDRKYSKRESHCSKGPQRNTPRDRKHAGLYWKQNTTITTFIKEGKTCLSFPNTQSLPKDSNSGWNVATSFLTTQLE